MYFSECTHSYGDNCQYSCSGQCVNQTCDRFNGKCLSDGKYGKICKNHRLKSDQKIFYSWLRLESILDRWSAECWFTTDVSACTSWIAAFSISLVINIIFLFATFLSRRFEIKCVLLRISNTHKSYLYFDFFLYQKLTSCIFVLFILM